MSRLALWTIVNWMSIACAPGHWSEKELAAVDAQGTTLLHRAARDGQARKVQALLAQGAAVNAKDKYERTPLHWAAIADEPAIAERLLDAGALIEAHAWYDMRPLHWASMKGNPDVMDVLIARGAAVDAPDFYGRTPLHVARNRKAIKVLLYAGARVDQRDHAGQTALHLVRTEGGAKALIDAGADMALAARDGRRPIDMMIAANQGPPEVIVFPQRTFVRLRHQRSRFFVQVMSVSENPIDELLLAARSHACAISVEPAAIARLHPAEIVTFVLTLTRLQGVEPGEHTLALTLAARQRPTLAELELRLDTRTTLTPEDRGMMRIPGVSVQAAPPRWHYIAYGSAPILLLLGWLLARRMRATGEGRRGAGPSDGVKGTDT